jgi:lipopolysaccharide export system protein LptA
MMFAILALGAVMASADTITSDGDTLSTGNNTTVALGTVSPGTTLHPTVRFFLSCAGNKHVDSGQTVTLSYAAGGSTVAAGGTLNASSGSIGPIPASWVDDGTSCPSPDPSPLSSGSLGSDSTVTITAPSAPGSYSYTVAYSAGLTPAGASDPSSVTGGIPTVTYTLTVAPSQQSQTITFGEPTSPRSYGDTFNVNPTASSGLTVTVAAGAGSVCTVAAAATGFDVTMTSGSGNCVLVASQSGNAGYSAAANVSRTVAAKPRPVTVAADAQSKTYGAADPALTYQVTAGSLVGGDSFGGGLARDAGGSVGQYDITQGTLALNSNYDLSFVGAKLTITARPVTVTADAQSKTYGDGDPALTYQVTSGSLVTGDSFGGGLARDAGGSVGQYDITQGTLALNSNYSLSYVGAKLTITARPVTVTADAQSKTYGHADPPLTYQVTAGSLVTGDSFSGSLARDAGGDVGQYDITQGTLALNSNYSLSYVGAKLTITARPVTVTADAQSKTYGDGDPALTYQVTAGSLVTGDSFGGGLARDAGGDVGQYDITQGTLALNSNYSLSYVGAKLTITVRPVTVTADNKTKVFGASDPALTYQITSGSLVTGDSFTGSLTRDPGESIGSYAITKGAVALSSNYNLAFVAGTLKIVYASSGSCNGATGHQVLQPINADGSSVYKGGSTVPVKFRVCDVNGVSIGSAGVVTSFRLVKTVAGTDTQVLDDGTTSTTPDTNFRWDPTDRQWIYNLSTKGLRTSTTYFYVITLNDGSTISFHFGLK